MSIQSNRRGFFKTSAFSAAAVCTAATTNAAKPFDRPYGHRFKLSLAGYSYRKYFQGDPKNNIPPSMTIMDFLDECAKMGLGAAEPTEYYFPRDADEDYFLRFKRHAFLLGLDISGTAIGNTFTHKPGSPKAESEIEACNKWVDASALFGAPCIRIFAGRKQEGDSFEQAKQYCIENTKIACDYAAKNGVFLAIENHGGIVSEPEPLIDIVEAIDSEWLGINLDGGNFHSKDPYKDIEMCAPYAVNVQLKVHMSGPDRKDYPADFGRIMDILEKADYRGYIALEYEASEEPKEAVPRYIEQLQKLIG